MNHRRKDPVQHDMGVVLYLPHEVYLGSLPLPSPAVLTVGRGYDRSLYLMAELFAYLRIRIFCAYASFPSQNNSTVVGTVVQSCWIVVDHLCQGVANPLFV